MDWRRKAGHFVVLLTFGFWVQGVSAQTEGGGAASGDEDGVLQNVQPTLADGHESDASVARAGGAKAPLGPANLNEDHGWPAGTIREQLDRDSTIVPFGKGAIFVPSLTNPFDEPPVSVWHEGEKLAEGTTGRRIVVLPGRYLIKLGSGAVDQLITREVVVRELHTSVVPVSWAGLVVHMMDERFASMRGTYEIIRVEDREYMGVGFGSDEQAGEPIATWVLSPGLYKIVRVGETYRARKDFATVRLVAGSLTDFLLVVDEETDAFKGAGEVPREELFLAGEEDLYLSLILGGDMSMNVRQGVLGVADGISLAFRAFLDTKLTAQLGGPLILRLQVEEGQTKAPEIPWQKTQDRADFDGLYIYKVFPWLGPYARFNIEANLLEGRQFFEEPRRVNILNADGTLRRFRGVDDSVRLLPPLGLTSIKEGAGGNVRVFKTLFGEMWVRAGIGARHQLTRNLIEAVDAPSGSDPDEVFYQRVPTTHQVGVETTFITLLRITRWVLVNVELDSLVPFDDIEGVVLELEAALAIKLHRFVSINYVLRYLRNPALFVGSDRPDQLQQDILLRFSIELP